MPDKVILIERCDGVQVGQDNDQYSCYTVSLPHLRLPSPEDLARQLLTGDTAWGDDEFSASRIRIPAANPHRNLENCSTVIDAGYGDTLVIIRKSRGIQLGDHNLQENYYEMRAGTVTVRAIKLGMSADRADLVRQAMANPSNHDVLRSLARDVAQSACRYVVAEATERVLDLIGHPATLSFEGGRIVGERAVQVGPGSRAVDDVEIELARQAVSSYERRLALRIEDSCSSIEPVAQDDVDQIGPIAGFGRGVDAY